MPLEAIDLIYYFATTYVHGSYRSVQYNPNNGIRLRNSNTRHSIHHQYGVSIKLPLIMDIERTK